MSVSSNGCCLVVEVCLKEKIYLPCGISFLCVKTSKPIVGMETVLVNTATGYCLISGSTKTHEFGWTGYV